MEVQGYVLEGISKLRCLSITELVLGVLGAIGMIVNFTRGTHGGIGGSIWSLIVTVLLIAAGALGVHAVKKVRSQIWDPNLFRICGILNIVLCVLSCLQLLVFAVISILLAVEVTTVVQLLEQVGIVDTEADKKAGTDVNDALYVGFAHITIIVVLVVGIIVWILMIGLTGGAARIARRNQAILTARARNAVAGYPLQPPGYTQYSAVKTQEMHHA